MSIFQGYIQNFYLVSGQNGHGVQCPNLPQECPTCGEFQNLQSSVQALQNQYLQHIKFLEEKLEAMEARLTKVEDCDCHKSCRLPGGLIHEDGASWSDDQCQLCSCVVSIKFLREINCRRVPHSVENQIFSATHILRKINLIDSGNGKIFQF